ncbi:uncharacterized protein MKZ38_007831 [Zalerion maritima]|uniref:Uncharacterized protein n=1 Tax=Zalerion maritima TaxID=339359 RepID=A0AAD5RIE8_9PEZI|nr:uncharacterized protein MKZ38_007831 [Zalerion maritima]
MRHHRTNHRSLVERKTLDDPKPPLDTAPPIIVIGIDFGTTYSGVAWTYGAKKEMIEVIMDWECHFSRNRECDKNCSAIHYEGVQKAITWGYDVPLDEDSLRWFKLLLIDEKDLSPEVRESEKIKKARDMLKKFNKTPAGAIGDYLRKMWNFSMTEITKAMGEMEVKVSRFHVVLTLPAIWPDYASRRMREAVKSAGILKSRPLAEDTIISFMPEPEAAALSSFEDMNRKATIEKEDCFVVADCGGGTVDLISYKVTSTSPTLTFEECVRGDGAMCGACFLDDNFLGLMKDKLKGNWNKLSAREKERLRVQCWEDGIKHKFDGKDSARTWPVMLNLFDMPADTSRCFKNHTVKLTNDEVASIFNPILCRVQDLIESQVRGVIAQTGKKPKYLILVGGFGRCSYLYEYLKSNLNYDVEILQPVRRAWSAICRGAVLKAIPRGINSLNEVTVQSHILRKSYGAYCRMSFVKGEHDERDKHWDETEMRYYARKQVEWIGKTDDRITANEPMVIELNSSKFDDVPGEEWISIYHSDVTPAPQTTYAPGVSHLCTIRYTPVYNLEDTKIYINPVGKVFHYVKMTIEMHYNGTSSLEFSVVVGSKRQGSHNVELDWGSH